MLPRARAGAARLEQHSTFRKHYHPKQHSHPKLAACPQTTSSGPLSWEKPVCSPRPDKVSYTQNTYRWRKWAKVLHSRRAHEMKMEFIYMKQPVKMPRFGK
jgi:hypothetical protein